MPWVASALVHTVIFAGLWESSHAVGERGPGSSATSDADRPDVFSTAAWVPPVETPPAEDDDTPRPDEAEPEFELAADPLAVARVDERPIADAPVPDEAETTLPETPTEAPLREPEPFPTFGPGHPIPRVAKTAVAAAPSPTPSPAQPVVAAPRPAAPPPPPPPSPARGGGGEGLRPPAWDPSNRLPALPADALARGERGRVNLRIRVTADGQVTAVSVVGSSGSVSLDAAAVATAWTWRYRPATPDGGASDAWALQGESF